MRPRVRRNLLGCAAADDLAARTAAFRAQIDDPVGGLDHIEVVLDHHDGVAFVAQPMQHIEQLCDIVKMQPGRRLIEYVERPAGGAFRQLAGQLDALGFAARQRGLRSVRAAHMTNQHR